MTVQHFVTFIKCYNSSAVSPSFPSKCSHQFHAAAEGSLNSGFIQLFIGKVALVDFYCIGSLP